MESQDHKDAVAKGILFHEQNKTWNGSDSKYYIKQLSKITAHYDASTILDYGCGKGLQYGPPYDFLEQAGLKSVWKYDPCVPKYDVLPPPSQQFDGVICIQVIKHIPDKDLRWVKALFERSATKFVLIADMDPSIPKKTKKILNTDSFHRDTAFYKEIFKDWDSPAELYFYWAKASTEEARNDNKKVMELTL